MELLSGNFHIVEIRKKIEKMEDKAAFDLNAILYFTYIIHLF